jgi:acyl-CoA synthetase (AMP-forming)/AMP-acid ligase II
VPTIPELVERAVRAYGPRTAVVDGDRQLTFAEVGERSGRLANALHTLGPEPGARVAILMRNRLEYIECDFGIARAAMVKVPINPRLSDDERRYILADAGVSVLITETSELARVAGLMADLPSAPLVIDVDSASASASADEATTAVLAYGALLAAAESVPAPLADDPERLSQLLYTSGTTGRPKGAMLADRCRVTATLMTLAEEFCPTPDDGMIHAGPLSHGSGSKVLTFFTRGARSITMAKFDPAAFFACVEAGGTSTFIVPTMVQMLVDHCRHSPPPPGLRNITYGGAGISRNVLESALEIFGPILTQVYGTSEMLHPVIALRHREEPDPAVSSSAAVPTGRPVSAMSFRLVADSPTDPADPVSHGELWMRGPQLMLGYWNNPAGTAETIVDGWYHTGDIAQLDEAGFLSIVDRAKDMIISGGLNVYPAEVERVLNQHPDVNDACVVGLTDDRWGEVVAAAVVRHDGSSLDGPALTEWSGERLAGYKKPRVVLFVTELPKGSTGKISKRDVRLLLDKGRVTT